MTLTITNNNKYITLTYSTGEVKDIFTDNIQDITLSGTRVYITYGYKDDATNPIGSNTITIVYSDVTSPVYASATLLKAGLLSMISDNSTNIQFIDEFGTAYGIKQIDGKPRVSSMPYTYDIAEGNVSGHTALYKFGSNPDIGTTEETIWQEGGLYDWAGVDAAPGIVTVSSSSADDVAVTGTGVRTCTIYGLSTLGATQSETVSLAGQTAVNSTLEYSRVNRIICNTAGTGLKNAGVIYVGTGTVTAGVPAVKWSTVAIGKNQTLQSIWTVPTGKTLYITSYSVSTNSNKGNIVNIYFRPTGELFQIKANAYLFSSSFTHRFELPLVLAGGTDIDCRGIGVATGAGITVTFEGWYE